MMQIGEQESDSPCTACKVMPARFECVLPHAKKGTFRRINCYVLFRQTLSPLPPFFPARRWREHGAAVAGIGAGVGRRPAEESRLRAADAHGVPVRRQRVPQQGMVGPWRGGPDGAG